jgi:hypothetical protein
MCRIPSTLVRPDRKNTRRCPGGRPGSGRRRAGRGAPGGQAVERAARRRSTGAGSGNEHLSVTGISKVEAAEHAVGDQGGEQGGEVGGGVGLAAAVIASPRGAPSRAAVRKAKPAASEHAAAHGLGGADDQHALRIVDSAISPGSGSRPPATGRAGRLSNQAKARLGCRRGRAAARTSGARAKASAVSGSASGANRAVVHAGPEGHGRQVGQVVGRREGRQPVGEASP